MQSVSAIPQRRSQSVKKSIKTDELIHEMRERQPRKGTCEPFLSSCLLNASDAAISSEDVWMLRRFYVA